MGYSAFETLVAPARATAAVWKVIAGFIGIALFWISGSVLFAMIVRTMLGQSWINTAVSIGDQPGHVFFLLATFLPATLGVCVVGLLLHHLSPSKLIGGLITATSQFMSAMRGLLPVLGVMGALLFMVEDVTPNLAFGTWLFLLPLALVFIFIQTSAEELVFRGYLQTQLAALNVPTVIWVLLPSILFGFAHYDVETFGRAAPWLVLWATVFGALAADLTARSGSLGPAVALHFANNAFAFLFVSFPDYLGGLALFTTTYSITDTDQLMQDLPLQLGMMVIMYIAVRIGIRR